MRATYTLSDHAVSRLRERCEVADPESALRRFGSLTEVTVSLDAKRLGPSSEATTHRLCFFPCSQRFAVLVVQTSFTDLNVDHHYITTAITTSMYEENVGRPLTDKEHCRAALSMLGPVLYRAWSLSRYGKVLQVNRTALSVHFKTAPFVWELKVRRALCEGFKLNEPLEATLAHPGALTAAHDQLKRIDRSLSDRHYMRLKSDFGTLKMTELTAKACPYCGMKPLPTDVSAEKKDPPRT